MKKTNYPIQNYKPYLVNNNDNDSEHEETIVPRKALFSAASLEVVAPSFKDYMFERMMKTADKNVENAVLEFTDREYDKLKVMSFFKRKIFCVKLLILHKIHDIKYNLSCRNHAHARVVKIRPAGSMMTLHAAMKRSAKLKSLKDFGDWIYDNWDWAKWDREFNWYMINTHIYINTPDERVGWRQTWIVTGPSGVENHIYPIAFTDKPFYKLKLNAADVEYIRNKYPKLLECVDDLKSGVSHESEIFRRYKEFAQEIDKAEPINLVATDRNNSDSLITKIADDIVDDINKNIK